MNYQTFHPSEPLGLFIKCYWTLESPKEAEVERQTIVPDGCMEMIFHYGDLYRQYPENGESLIQPRCFVFGQLTKPLKIEPTGVTGILSVRFHPDGFLPFSSFAIKKIENRAISLKEIFEDDGLVLEEMVLKAKTTEERIKIVESFLISQLKNENVIDGFVRSTVETILTANGQIPIDDLTKQINVNRRQLERKFSSAIGLSPKQLSKMIRLQSTLRLMLNKQFTSLTSLAYENDYYDQAHFIKDFKEFTGMTPKEFYGGNLKMSALFFGSE